MAEDSLKREFRIDSTDAARPPATLQDEPAHFAQGLKPKPRVIVSVQYEELDEKVSRGKNLPLASVILKTSTYDDGVTIDTTVGEDNEGYQQHLRGETSASNSSGSTRLRQPTKKPTAPKKTTSKE